MNDRFTSPPETTNRGLALNLLLRLLNVLLVFVINILISRLAGVAGYGLISLLLANAGLFNLVSAFGSDAGISYHAASGRLANQKLLGFVWAITGIQLLAALLFDWFFRQQYGHSWFIYEPDVNVWWLGVIYLLSIALTEKYAALLNGNRLFSRYSRLLLLSNLLMLAGLLVLLVQKQSPIVFETVLTVYVLFSLLQSVLLMFAWHTTKGHRLQVSALTAKDTTIFFSYSLIAFIINCIQFFAYRIDYWLIDYYRDRLELGWYSMAVRLSQFFWVLPLLLAGMIAPLVAAARQNANENRMPAILRWMNMLNVITASVLFLAAGWFIPFLFGGEYAQSITLFRILLPGVVLFCNATIIAAFYAGKNQLRLNLFGSMLCLGIILILDLLLIPAYGMKGASVASSIGYGVTGLYYLASYTMQQKTGLLTLLIPEKKDIDFIKALFSGKNEK